MLIYLISLDDSSKIKIGGKHVHQVLLGKALEIEGHTLGYIFPRKDLVYFIVKLVLKFLEKFSLVSRSTSFEYTLNLLKRSLKHQINTINSSDGFFCQDSVSACALMESRWRKSRRLLTLHGYLGKESVNYLGLREDDAMDVLKIADCYEKKAVRNVDLVICVDSKISEYVRNELDYRGNVLILKNAVNPDVFESIKESDVKESLVSFNFEMQKTFLLVPRRLVRKNGVDIVLEAISRLSSDVRNRICVLIVGDGPEKSNLINQANKLELDRTCLRFLGAIDNDDIKYFYHISKFILIPSVIRDGVEEATSLSMLEGMAAKKVVVASAIGGMKEVIRDQQNGFLFEQGNYDQLSHLIEVLMNSLSNDKYTEISQNGFNDVIANHHYRHHAREYLSNLMEP